MKTIEEIKLYFRISLAKELKNLDKERRKAVRQSLLWGMVLLFAIVIIFFILFIYLDMIVTPLILLFALFVYCESLIVIFLGKKYAKSFQNDVIMKLIEFADTNLSYRPHGYIPEYLFKESAIFRRKHSQYEGKNLVCGKIDGTSITSSYLRVKNNGYAYESWNVPIFNGPLFIVELNPPITGRTVVVPEMEMQEHPTLSLPIRIWERWNECDPVVKTDHCEFEKHFVTHGNSPQHTRNLLCPELLQAILDFKIKQQSHLFLSFLDSKLFIAIAGLDPFSHSLFSTPLDFEPIQYYFEYLSFCMNLKNIINSAAPSNMQDDSYKKQ